MDAASAARRAGSLPRYGNLDIDIMKNRRRWLRTSATTLVCCLEPNASTASSTTPVYEVDLAAIARSPVGSNRKYVDHRVGRRHSRRPTALTADVANRQRSVSIRGRLTSRDEEDRAGAPLPRSVGSSGRSSCSSRVTVVTYVIFFIIPAEPGASSPAAGGRPTTDRGGREVPRPRPAGLRPVLALHEAARARAVARHVVRDAPGRQRRSS